MKKLGLFVLSVSGLSAGALAQGVQNAVPPPAVPAPIAPPMTSPMASPAQPLSFYRASDPTEGAFTVEVPRGWQVERGTKRLSAVDVRHSVRVSSPDRQILAFRGDTTLGFFTLPSRLTDMANLHEGSVYQGPAGAMVIRQYIPGADFVKAYLGGAQAQCPGLRMVNQENFGQASQQLAGELNGLLGGIAQFRLDSGAVDFVCGTSGNVGSVTATTMLTRVAGAASPSIWVVLDISGFVAPPEWVPEAAEVVARLQSSFRYDPAWAARQEQTTQQVSGILQRQQDSVGRTLSQTYQQRSRTLDSVFARGAEARRGTVTIDDPALGRRTITNSHRHYWTNPQGQIVGTDTDTSPGPGYRALRIVTP